MNNWLFYTVAYGITGAGAAVIVLIFIILYGEKGVLT